MTEGSLKLTDTALISRSWTAITSTFPWHQRVIAFCQSTTLRGSYEALRRSACSMTAFMITGGPMSCPERGAANTSELSKLRRYDKNDDGRPCRTEADFGESGACRAEAVSGEGG